MVKAQLRAARRLRPGGIKPSKEIFDHVPLTMVHRYKLAVYKSRQSETTRWHYARLKHAMDNPEPGCNSRMTSSSGQIQRAKTSDRGQNRAVDWPSTVRKTGRDLKINIKAPCGLIQVSRADDPQLALPRKRRLGRLLVP